MTLAGNFVVRRCAGSFLTALLAVSLAFWVIHVIPGDPATAILSGGGDQVPSPEALASVRLQLGLDKPVLVQFGDFLMRLTHFDLGTSFVTRRPVLDELLVRVPRTLQIAIPATILALGCGLLLGMLSASNPGRWIDSAVTTMITLLFAIPVFVYAIALGYLLSIKLGWLPVGRYVSPWDDLGGYLQRAILPVLALSLMPMAVIARTARTALIDQRTHEYVKLAYAKGLSAKSVLLRHIMPNALVPVAAITGLQFGQLLASSVLVEYAFNWPGLNLYMIQSIGRRDYPAVVGVVIVISLAFVIVNLLTDLLYGWLDPRVTVTRER